MSGYAKLFSSIIHSTIWRESNHVRIVWITMIAMANKNGIVEASIPGLADVSRVDLEECEKALARLLAPDAYSRNPDNEGRRIEEVGGGWRLLNYEKYRDMLRSETDREQNAERQRRFRERQKEKEDEDKAKSNGVVTGHNGEVTGNAPPSSDPSSDPSSEEQAKHARVDLREEYEYMGELETKTQRIVALAMGTFKHWPQIEVEANVLKMMGFCEEFTLENWEEVLREADKYTEARDRYKSPYKTIVSKIKWLQAKLKGRANEKPEWDPEIDPLKQGWTYFLPLGMNRPFNGGQAEALAYSRENDPPEKYDRYVQAIEEFNAKRIGRTGN